MPDFIKEYAKNRENRKKSTTIDDKIEHKDREINTINVKKMDKPAKRKQNLLLAKKINAKLDKINFKNNKIGQSFELSKDKKENIMACIFYGFNTNIAVNVEKDIYQVKDTPLIEAKLTANETTVFNNIKLSKMPEIVVFDQLTKMMGFQFGFVNKMSVKILNKFGLDFKLPKIDK